MTTLNYEAFWDTVGANSHYQFEKAIKDLLLNPNERNEFYKKILKINSDVSKDIFKDYFEIYAAERKTNQQDYTPASVSKILTEITYNPDIESLFTAADYTAGTGTLLITKWWEEMTNQTPWTYAPHNYFYFAQEFADNVIAFLLHNLAIRGMNAIVIHGDTLNKSAKQIYFIQNSKDDFLSFSDINIMPHSKEVMDYFNIEVWEEDECKHIESYEVAFTKICPRIKKEKKKPKTSPKCLRSIPWRNLTRIKQVAFVERAKKGKIYEKGTIIIQISATSGEMGLLKSSGEVELKYACVIPFEKYGKHFSSFLFYSLQLVISHWFQLRKQGLNITIEDIEDMPIYRF